VRDVRDCELRVRDGVGSYIGGDRGDVEVGLGRHGEEVDGADIEELDGGDDEDADVEGEGGWAGRLEVRGHGE